ncbi:hypothetical protein [Desulfonatronum thioautotrophicum]|nr:hypothetical protein [Desulfonatronum thioautotrophicum]
MADGFRLPAKQQRAVTMPQKRTRAIDGRDSVVKLTICPEKMR